MVDVSAKLCCKVVPKVYFDYTNILHMQFSCVDGYTVFHNLQQNMAVD